jgi:hypothetical protein
MTSEGTLPKWPPGSSLTFSAVSASPRHTARVSIRIGKQNSPIRWFAQPECVLRLLRGATWHTVACRTRLPEKSTLRPMPCAVREITSEMSRLAPVRTKRRPDCPGQGQLELPEGPPTPLSGATRRPGRRRFSVRALRRAWLSDLTRAGSQSGVSIRAVSVRLRASIHG